jgi:membrane-bound inhibitor of C-type lysozyme
MTMKAFTAAALVTCLVSACSSPSPTSGSLAQELDVTFSCTNGESLSVRFVNERSIAVLTRNGESIELAQQPSGSGFIYSDGPNTIRGKGKDLSVEIGRMVRLECKAR